MLEAYAAFNHTEPVLIWLWECKDYPNRKVKVDEIEELHSKKMQVGAHKATVVTRNGFQSSAVAFAKSNGIGLMTLNREMQFALCMSQDAGIVELDEIVGAYCLYTFGLEIGDDANCSGPMLRTMIDFEFSHLAL